MIVLFDRITKGFNKPRATRALTLDISKAHDMVWHACLLHEFKSYGFPGRVFGIILSILNNRILQVVLDGNSLKEFLVNARAQCSNFDPTLFLLYINDLIDDDDVICDIAIYADNTTRYSKCD